MKDACHHLKHIQRKVIQESRKTEAQNSQETQKIDGQLNGKTVDSTLKITKSTGFK